MRNLFKKVLAVAVALCLCLQIGVPALAADAAAIRVDDVQAKAGETVTININLENNPGVAALKLEVNFDPETLEYVNAYVSSEFAAGANAAANPGAAAEGSIIFNWMNTYNDVYLNGAFAVLELKVKDTAAPGTYDITASYNQADVFNFDWEDVVFTVVNGSITVLACEHVMEHHEAVPATCTETGIVEYWSCTECGKLFADEAGETQITDTTAPATGHAYDLAEPVWNWSEDYSTASVTFCCTACDDAQTVDAVVTHETIPATHTEDGQEIYKATAEFADQSHEDIKTITIPATGHSYEGEPEWCWIGEHEYATARFYCTGCDYSEEKLAEISSETTPATCEANGRTVYTATVVFEGETYTTTETEVLPALGHDYSAPVWSWDGYTAATATFTCANGHEETVTAEVTRESVGADCDAPGSITYTATVEFNGETYTDEKTEEVDAIGHDWHHDFPLFTWNEDCTAATVTFTCGNDASHVMTVDAAVEITVVDPTCEADGYTYHVARVTFDGHSYSEDRTFPNEGSALGHAYGEPVWSWSEDHATATATFTCGNDASHVEVVTVDSTSVHTEPTCDEEGKTVYTATVEFNGETYTAEATVTFPANGHTYGEPVWNWDGYTGAAAVFGCTVCDREDEITAEVTSETTPATCTEDGQTVYTATVVFEDETHTDTQTEVHEKLGHAWSEPVWSWSGDWGWDEQYAAATAAFTCANDANHMEILEAVVTSETTPATCEADGQTVYTATVEFNGETYTTTATVVLPALGHAYGEPEWTWIDNCAAATATFTCANDETHVVALDAVVTSEYFDPTCEVDGHTVYTATVEFNGQSYSTQFTVGAEPPLGHAYGGDPIWTWSRDNKSATASFACANDETHFYDVEAEVTAEITDATYTEAGQAVYTAVAEFNGETYTEVKVVEIPVVVVPAAPKPSEPAGDEEKDESVIVETDENGDVSVTVNEEAIEEGEAVTLPVEVESKTSEEAAEIEIVIPAGSGTVVIEIPVTDVTESDVIVIVKEDGTEEIVAKTKMTENGLAIEVEGTVTVKVVKAETEYTDMEEVEDELAAAVDFVSARGLFNGVGNDLFAPGATMNRAMLATVLFRLEKGDASGFEAIFSDVHDGKWYSEAIMWGVEKGIMKGYGTSFGVTDALTYEQMAVMLYRLAGEPEVNTVAKYASEWAKKAMAWAVTNGIIVGEDDEEFDSRDEVSRIEAAAMLMRYLGN